MQRRQTRTTQLGRDTRLPVLCYRAYLARATNADTRQALYHPTALSKPKRIAVPSCCLTFSSTKCGDVRYAAPRRPILGWPDSGIALCQPHLLAEVVPGKGGLGYFDPPIRLLNCD